ncbi:hypothetical protein PP713_19055 [Mycobacterium sp. CSUR Q5927]|nr:hypothetical protein [Mycobacterium sp. CSUR Q5927]
MMRRWGKLAAGAACGVLVAIGATPAAHAEPEVPSGQYAFSAQHGPSQRSATWTFTPCGPTCTTVDGERWLQNADFHLNGGRWEYSGRGSMDCPVDHTPLPVSKTVSFDAVTLAGQWTTATLEQCGRGPAGGVVGQWDFQLTKTG